MEQLLSRAQKSAETKKMILNAGRKLFRKYGYNNIQVSAIAKEAGVSIGTFYHHFESKAQLFGEISEGINSHFSLDSDIDYANDSCMDRVLAHFRHYGEFISHLPIESSSALYLNGVGNKTFLDTSRSMYQVLAAMIEGFQKTGQVKQLPPMDVVDDLFICARGVIYNWLIHDSDFDLTARMTAIIERIFLSYMTNPPYDRI